MSHFNFIKGVLVGIAKIIPGFSGAILMISFNLYDRAIDAITHFFSDVKGNFFFLLELGIGVLVGIVLFSRVIAYFLLLNYLYTNIFFVGLIFGGIPVILKKISCSYDNFFCFFISFLFVFVLSIFHLDYVYRVQYGLFDIFFFFIAGFFEAIGTVLPGISSTALLMLLGIYPFYIQVIGNIFSLSMFWNHMFFLVPFSFGMILGIISISLLVNYLFCNYKERTFASILGFSFGSVLLLIIKLIPYVSGLFSIIISFIFFLIGFFVTYKL